MMTPHVVGEATVFQSSTDGKWLRVPRPDGLERGDLVLIAHSMQSNQSESDYTSEDGLERFGAPFQPKSAARVRGLLGKFVDDPADEPVTYDLAIQPEWRATATAFAVRGVSRRDPVAAHTAWAGTDISDGNGKRCEAVELDPADEHLVVIVGGAELTANNPHDPTVSPAGDEVARHHSGEGEDASRTAIVVHTTAVSGEAGFGPVDVSWPAAIAPHAQMVALRGKPDTGPGFDALHGDGARGLVFATDADGKVFTPSALVPVSLGFRSVAEVLACKGVTMGHRGNSIRYAEMSLHAYTQAAARGYGLLEVSLNKTSDEVYFGLHDNDINRVAGTTDLPACREMTWAEISEHRNQTGQDGRAQPFMRLEDYLTAYGDTHVTMIDLKDLWPRDREHVYGALDGTQNRIIMKVWGGSTGVAQEAKDRGFVTWGYFYPNNVTEGKLRDHGPFDLIGMDKTATDQEWQACFDTGKPVWGHIAENQADYDTLVNDIGCVGVQCAASHLIRAVGPFT